MQELVRIVVDAMGGDNAPQSTVKGTVDALNRSSSLSETKKGNFSLKFSSFFLIIALVAVSFVEWRAGQRKSLLWKVEFFLCFLMQKYRKP